MLTTRDLKESLERAINHIESYQEAAKVGLLDPAQTADLFTWQIRAKQLEELLNLAEIRSNGFHNWLVGQIKETSEATGNPDISEEGRCTYAKAAYEKVLKEWEDLEKTKIDEATLD